MKWFKHYSSAKTSNAITEIFAQFGFEGYGRYWFLLELMCEKFDGEQDQKFVFKTKDLRDMMGFYHTNALSMYLQCLANVGLMSFECDKNVTRIYSDILLRLKGRDFKKARSDRAQTAPKNKDKRIKNKEKETRARIFTISDLKIDQENLDLAAGMVEAGGNAAKVVARKFDDELIQNLTAAEVGHQASVSPKITIDPMHVVDLWNEMLGPEKGYSSGLGSGEHLKNFLNSTGFLPTIEHWRKLFGMVKASKFLIEKPWCKLTWLVNYDNALKVLDGNYTDDQNENAVRALNKQAIKAAITSGYTSIKDLPPGMLKTDEIDFVKNNGGLLQLGRMNEFELNQLLNKGGA